MPVYLFSLFPDLFSFSRGVQDTQNWKSNKCLRILPPGPLRWFRTAAFALCPLPVHVPGHCVGEPAHHISRHLWPPPPHPYVLLPLQPVLGWHRFHLHHSSQGDCGHPISQQSHHLFRLPDSDVYFYPFCMYGLYASYCDAYDRFVAICHPLHYTVIMNPCLCCSLVLVSFCVSLLDSQVHNVIVLQLTCFKDVEISSFFCDPSQLLNLACSDTFTDNTVSYTIGALTGFLSISGIIFSYCKILVSILRVPSLGGRYKAFSTCGSHLTVVCLFYGTGLGVYLSSAISQSPRKDAVASVVYTVVTPMLNPFIYSLRNRDIKRAMFRFLSKTM